MSNRRYTSQYLHSMHRKLVVLHCKWKTLSTDANGLVALAPPTASGGFGQPNASNLLYGIGINTVVGYSSAPATGNNMLAGNVMVTLQDNYLAFVGMTYTFTDTVTGSAVNVTTGLTLGKVYQITTVGTTTTAGWVTLGVPSGVTPAVGVAFVAATASAGTGTGAVKGVGASAAVGTYNMEVAGEPNLTLNPTGQVQGFGGGPGGTIILNIWAPTNSSTTTALLTNPIDNTVVNVNFFLLGQ